MSYKHKLIIPENIIPLVWLKEEMLLKQTTNEDNDVVNKEWLLFVKLLLILLFEDDKEKGDWYEIELFEIKTSIFKTGFQ